MQRRGERPQVRSDGGPTSNSALVLLSTGCTPKLALPRNNPDEVRSFRFFLEITAPSLSGVFDSEFWNSELPRTCHADSAIWHAVVCLGAVYESYALSSPSSSSAFSYTTGIPRKGQEKYEFSLRQFNLAIKYLLNAAPSGEDKWRTVSASILFTEICSIQGLHREARVHLDAGRNLLCELEEDDAKLPSHSSLYAKTTPVSLCSIRAIVTDLDLRARALTNGPIRYTHVYMPGSDQYTAWRYYQPPPPPSRPPPLAAEALSNDPLSSASSLGRRFQCVTSGNLLEANRAAESLFNAILLAQAESVDDIVALARNEGAGKLEKLVARQEPYMRCFANLTAALRAFGREIEGGRSSAADHCCSSSTSTSTPPDPWLRNLTKAYLTLKLYHSVMRLLFFHDAEMPELRQDAAKMGAYYRGLVDMAERILQLGVGVGRGAAPSSSFNPVPVPSTTQPLAIVALSGIPQSNRRRAIALFRRYPRREGLWDTTFAAALTELIMAREKEILAERREGAARNAAGDGSGVVAGKGGDGEEEKGRGEEGGPGENKGGHDDDDDDEIVEALDRQYGTRVSFEGERRAHVTLYTWRGWIAGQPGETRLLEW
ncbi:hypothetical protein SLS62_010958 [Diatrype stigma]|uniref:Uncharacterized protein n=1 Tax=Diatrype stigma TaxID=117547 RepID=A0AAN9YFJ5_9PEZI